MKRPFAIARGLFFISRKITLAICTEWVYNGNMEKRNDKRKLNAWLNAELLDKVQKMATEQNRTLSNMIETILYEAVEKK